MSLPEEQQQVTVGEVFRALGLFRDDVDKGFDRLHTRLDNMSVVTTEQYTQDQTKVEERVNKVEQSNTWLMRMVVTEALGLIGWILMARGGA